MNLNSFLVLCFLLFSAGWTNASDDNTAFVNDQYLYKPDVNAAQRVQDALSKAKEQNKNLILVLGAQWCHDSRGLAANFSTSEMQTLLNASYETVFVDVGHLEDRRHITQPFGFPGYFATPTVLVVDSETGSLLNNSEMSIWANADRVPLTTYVDYFSKYSTPPSNTSQTSEKIKQFGQQQAERLQQAYAILGPMLEQDIKGSAPDDFLSLWKEVKTFRMAVLKDLDELNTIKSQKNEVMTLPTYGPFSWEK